MNAKLSSVTVSLSYTTASNILQLLVNVAIVLVIPKFVDVEGFAYFQLYLFYIAYSGIVFLGWNEGIYLRVGGKYYWDLDKPEFCTQFWLMAGIAPVIFFTVFMLASHFENNANYLFTYGAVCMTAVAMNLRWFMTYLLQATARLKESAITFIIDRVVFSVLAVLIVLLKCVDYRLVLAADVAAKYISMLTGFCYCRDVLLSKFHINSSIFKEIGKNISVGINMMIATLCSVLITGVVRMGIEIHWGVVTFGKISLSLNISNMIVVAIAAIAVTLYPLLRRVPVDALPEIYKVMRTLLMGLLFFAITFYYPARKLLDLWLPQYSDSLQYAAILLPFCVFEGKTTILLNTFYNTLRQEKLLMKCNIISVILSIFVTVFVINVFNSTTACVYSILFVLCFRCVLCEVILSKKMSIRLCPDLLWDIVMSAVFIVCNRSYSFTGMAVYAACYCCYLVINRQNIAEAAAYLSKSGLYKYGK